MATFTSIAKVRNRATGYLTSPADAAITQYIEHAEGIIIAVSRHDWINVNPKFNASKHVILEQACTDLAAHLVVASDPSVSTTNAEAALMMDAFWASAARALLLLSDKRVIEFLKGL